MEGLDHSLADPLMREAHQKAYLECQKLLASGDFDLGEISEEIVRLEEYQSPSSATRCEVTWSHNAVAYKCQDCQFDSTWCVDTPQMTASASHALCSVICVDCFQDSDHRGHNCT